MNWVTKTTQREYEDTNDGDKYKRERQSVDEYDYEEFENDDNNKEKGMNCRDKPKNEKKGDISTTQYEEGCK